MTLVVTCAPASRHTLATAKTRLPNRPVRGHTARWWPKGGHKDRQEHKEGEASGDGETTTSGTSVAQCACGNMLALLTEKLRTGTALRAESLLNDIHLGHHTGVLSASAHPLGTSSGCGGWAVVQTPSRPSNSDGNPLLPPRKLVPHLTPKPPRKPLHRWVSHPDQPTCPEGGLP